MEYLQIVPDLSSNSTTAVTRYKVVDKFGIAQFYGSYTECWDYRKS
jgi:hypothetical protein